MLPAPDCAANYQIFSIATVRKADSAGDRHHRWRCCLVHAAATTMQFANRRESSDAVGSHPHCNAKDIVHITAHRSKVQRVHSSLPAGHD